MKKYKFAHIDIELENPIIQTTNVNYSIGGARVTVTLEFTADNTDEIKTVVLGGMPNVGNWSDADVTAFSLTEFEKFNLIQL